MTPIQQLPLHSEQLLSLLRLLDSLKAQASTPLGNTTAASATATAGAGADMPPFKGIIFVEQVAMTYPLAHLINSHFHSLGDTHTDRAGPKDPVALPVSGSHMSDIIR